MAAMDAAESPDSQEDQWTSVVTPQHMAVGFPRTRHIQVRWALIGHAPRRLTFAVACPGPPWDRHRGYVRLAAEITAKFFVFPEDCGEASCCPAVMDLQGLFVQGTHACLALPSTLYEPKGPNWMGS